MGMHDVRHLDGPQPYRYGVDSWNDGELRLDGMTYQRRMEILRGVLASATNPANYSPDYLESMERDYALWAAVTMLRGIMRKHRITYETPKETTAERAKRQASIAAGQRPHQLKGIRTKVDREGAYEHIPEGSRHPIFTERDLADSIGKAYRHLNGRIENQTMAIPVAALHRDVIKYICLTNGAMVPEAALDVWGTMAREGKPVPLPKGIPAYRTRQLGSVLNFYGVGTSYSDGSKRVISIRYWAIKAILTWHDVPTNPSKDLQGLYAFPNHFLGPQRDERFGLKRPDHPTSFLSWEKAAP